MPVVILNSYHNNKDVIIIIDNKKEIRLNEVQLPKYKFIYVGKDKNHYTLNIQTMPNPFYKANS
jgi:hypothetical protein